MTEPSSETQCAPIVEAARNLREIERLAGQLAKEAANASNARLMPGGKAMVLLGPHGSLEAWENRQQTTERTGKAYTVAFDEDPEDHWDSLQLILFWSEACRRELGEEYGLKPTLVSEAAYLRHRLEHLWDNEPRFDDMAADVRKARTRLEDVLHDGTRAERSRVVCDCDEQPRLIRVYGEHELADGWKCPACRARYTQDDHERMFARMLRSEGAQKFVPAVEAVALLRREGRPDRTIRKWLGVSDDHEDVVEGYCEVRSKRHHVWWPSLWTRHLTTKTRKRGDAA